MPAINFLELLPKWQEKTPKRQKTLVWSAIEAPPPFRPTRSTNCRDCFGTFSGSHAQVFTAEVNGHMTGDKVTNFPSFSYSLFDNFTHSGTHLPPTAGIVSAPFPAHMQGIYCRIKGPYNGDKVTNFPSFSTRYLTILPIPAHTFHQLPRLFRHLFRLTHEIFTAEIHGHMTVAR
jgi:hypothetical protein